jgi:hypothetical protein
MEFHGIMKLRFHGIPWNFVNWRNLMEFGFDRAVLWSVVVSYTNTFTLGLCVFGLG